MAIEPLKEVGGPQKRAAGQQTAELFEKYSRLVYGLCRMLLRDHRRGCASPFR